MNLGVLSRRSWSPYVAGAGLGLIAAVSLAFFGQRLGASGAYLGLVAYAGRALFPENVYFRAVVPPQVGFQAYVVIGVLLGAFASAVASGDFRIRSTPEAGWREAFGPRPGVRWALAFLGAFLVEAGASIAGGCTSGLAVSGGVVLAPGAFVFMAGMFAAGIPTAVLVARRARR